MLQVHIFAASNSIGWTGIVLAVLGSSAVGAVVGGIITTSLRGRIERDEAWRTRLIEAADEYQAAMSGALLAYEEALLADAAAGKRPVRNEHGDLAEALADVVKAGEEQSTRVNQLLYRILLLYGGPHKNRFLPGLRQLTLGQGLRVDLSPYEWALQLWIASLEA